MRIDLTRSRTLAVAAGKSFVAALAIAAVASFTFYTHQPFLKYPPVWPDESLFANAAINLLHQKALATSLLSGIVPGVEHRTYLMPPVYYCYLGCVFSVWGASIFAVRLASLAAALLIMGLTYSLGLRSGLDARLSLIPVSLLAPIRLRGFVKQTSGGGTKGRARRPRSQANKVMLVTVRDQLTDSCVTGITRNCVGEHAQTSHARTWTR